MIDLFEQRLREAARATPTPPPPVHLVARIVTERADGQRVRLPVIDTRRRVQRGRGLLWLMAAAAALLLVTVTPRLVQRAAQGSAADSVVSDPGLFVLMAFAGEIARGPAQPP